MTDAELATPTSALPCNESAMSVPTHHPRTAAGEQQVLSSVAALIVFFLAALVLFVFGRTVSNDALEYDHMWYAVHDAGLLNAWRAGRHELGSVLVYGLFAQLLSPGATFYAVGLAAFSVKYYLLRKYTVYPFLALCLYVALFLHTYDASRIRIALAACFILYALLASTGRTSYLVLAGVASVFHYSGLIIGVLYFVRAPFIGLASIVVLSFAWNYLLTSSDTLTVALRFFFSTGEGEVHLTNSIFVMQAVIASACALEWKGLTEAQRKGAYFLMSGAVFYVFFFDNPILAHGLRELSLLGLIPLLFLGRHKLTYAFSIIWLCVGYIVVYELRNVMRELLEVASVM